MAPEHRDFLRFMWFDDVFKSYPELISLRFPRVLFGLTCSPFLLNRTVKCHLLKYTQFTDIKEFVEKFLHNLYVDDSVNSFDKLSDCLKVYKVSKSCLANAGFDLRKRKSNDSRFENYINQPACVNSTVSVNLDNPSLILNKIGSVNCSSTKVLGLNWDTTSDNLIFNFGDIFFAAVNLPVTKRNILKISSTFFDPLGFIIPITLPAKVLYKDIWLEKYTWDSEIR